VIRMSNSCDKYRKAAVVFETAATALYRMATDNPLRTKVEFDALVYASSVLENVSAEINATEFNLVDVTEYILNMLVGFEMPSYIESMVDNVLRGVSRAISSL